MDIMTTKQLATLRIAFSVDTDDEALEIKKKISEVFKDRPDVQVQFGLTNASTRPPVGPPMPS